MFIAAQVMHIAAIIREGQRLSAWVGSKSKAIRFDADLKGLSDDAGAADPTSERLALYLSTPDQGKDKRHGYRSAPLRNGNEINGLMFFYRFS